MWFLYCMPSSYVFFLFCFFVFLSTLLIHSLFIFLATIFLLILYDTFSVFSYSILFSAWILLDRTVILFDDDKKKSPQKKSTGNGDKIAWKTVVFGINSMSGARNFSRGEAEWNFSLHKCYLSEYHSFPSSYVNTIAKENSSFLQLRQP